MTITLNHEDLPEPLSGVTSIAVDTEAMGLRARRDRLCLVQLSVGDGNAHLVKIAKGQTAAPNLVALLQDPSVTKLFHFARFDMGILAATFGVIPAPCYCTKIASKLARTYTDRHGLKDLTRELLHEETSKHQQSSDWGAETLTDAQKHYAATDVYNLHRLRERLDEMLAREGRMELATKVFEALPTRVALDIAGFEEMDIFAHS